MSSAVGGQRLGEKQFLWERRGVECGCERENRDAQGPQNGWVPRRRERRRRREERVKNGRFEVPFTGTFTSVTSVLSRLPTCHPRQRVKTAFPLTFYTPCLIVLLPVGLQRSDGGVGLESPSPTLDELPLGSDNNTWPNVVRNKRNTLYCTTTFKTLGNRMRCVTDFTSSGLLD